jgi:hypothetical protein
MLPAAKIAQNQDVFGLLNFELGAYKVFRGDNARIHHASLIKPFF